MNAGKMMKYVLNGNRLINVSCFFALLTVLQILPALGASPQAPFPEVPDENYSSAKDDNPHQTRHKFKQYVKDKYQNIHDAESTVKQTLHGPSGTVWINGEINPINKPVIDLSTKHDSRVSARAIAKVFIDDEHLLLGITDPIEIKEVSIYTSKGHNGDYINIYYNRYINGVELENADMRITIGPTQNITSVNARLKPVTPEVYVATKNKTLSEEEVRSIVESDLKEIKVDSKEQPKTYKKIAILSKPYVVWKATNQWFYTIDAFTGEIMSKISMMKAGPSYPIKKDYQENISPPMYPPVLPQK